jgi:Arm DNA-binding domain
MKPKGQHRNKALTPGLIKSIRVPGRYSDGNGLYLVVSPSGAKRWIMRIVIRGRRRDVGLGGLSLVSLNEARASARLHRRRAREAP